MADDSRGADAARGADHPDDEEDLGEPVRELRDYVESPSPAFLGRVLGSVRRRSLGSQLATFAWSALGEALMEFFGMIHSLFSSGDPDRRK